MKFVVASYGTRGDIEPCAAIGRELLRRGHEVCMAVPPDLIALVESAGLAAVPYGPDTRAYMEAQRRFWTCFFRSCWRIRDLIKLGLEVSALSIRLWEEVCATLTSLADGADLLFTTIPCEQAAANVAEYYDIPLATLHYYPVRANGQLIPVLPGPLIRAGMKVSKWLSWRMNKGFEDAHRRELGLPKSTSPTHRRIAERRSLEIQAYDEFCFPGLAAEWAKWDRRRPFVGSLTMDLVTDADDRARAWIAEGAPPICFAFGSIPVEFPAATVEMISQACAQLGERALICAGVTDYSNGRHSDHVKVVGAVNYAEIFPICRAVVHHGGAGTTAAGLRAGVPALVLWTEHDQPFWGAQVKRLRAGASRRLSTTTQESLVSDLRRILTPECIARAREIATQMTKPDESASAAADLVEDFARLGRVR
ncbi:glycosyltransferase [Mycobacterium intracellulare]|uniref:Glycosyltransferase n=1 Tax=Mycobacterium intracellulare TaxID=1767 RepID=A0AAE4RJY3_MYCIT|nr:glycosyltransferase [Mycobacterium intracellulare]MCA2323183.1 glycosyltransferase [Mycobacterium intracellulare]MCA2344055.1 glycosyltransferase [Mycobacterium intracellulare]MDV6980181.1 glycosyltransferase [Mycobacterium intracellulare]MDV6985807.1 glycosyltransferase [Mycobacterium intracellulare]MDV7016232.1 glycosyltransferase [Mycobacterium intracellulare]